MIAKRLCLSGVARGAKRDRSADLRLSDFRPLTLGLLLTFNFSLLIPSCGLDVEDPTPPSPPVWVEKSLPEEWPERVIDAEELGGIKLEWESPKDEDINAHLIYRAIIDINEPQMANYELLARVEMESTAILTYTDYIVSDRVEYSYKLRAEDNSNNVSDYSDTLIYSLLPQILKPRMIPNGVTDILGGQRKLMWAYGYAIEMEDYTLTILTANNEFIGRYVFTPTVYTTVQETWVIPMEHVLVENQVYKWRIDTGADYMGGLERKGSESEWAYFVYCCYH